jgi:acetolactate synthase small subunit
LGTSALSRIISLFANDIFNIESLFQFFSNVV